jgi:hypothetical protein
MRAMKRRKPSKALEKATRAIKDSDEFLDHIGGIADLYRREHARDATPRAPALRQSLKTFSKHTGALLEWLEQARLDPSSAEHDALNKLGSVLYGTAHRAYTTSAGIAEWLTQADAAATRCLDDATLFPKKPQRHAPLAAADALRATFEYHKLKFSAQVTKTRQSDAVRLLCALARNAGDATLTAAEAQEALRKPAKPDSGKS